ncbi:hypothetical protein JCM17843_21660 [Kordiimonadales bacterium JCM 17843]|nr:hypothetical protein JCM17843_21660 [Kordiimonadales bacterium JCM 17843]
MHSETWDVSLRKGHHEALIGFGTHEKILYNLENGGRPAARRDFSQIFRFAASCTAMIATSP